MMIGHLVATFLKRFVVTALDAILVEMFRVEPMVVSLPTSIDEADFVVVSA